MKEVICWALSKQEKVEILIKMQKVTSYWYTYWNANWNMFWNTWNAWGMWPDEQAKYETILHENNQTKVC